MNFVLPSYDHSPDKLTSIEPITACSASILFGNSLNLSLTIVRLFSTAHFTLISVKMYFKYYNKKDFALAKKAISEMKKRNWNSALKTAQKAKDKSIFNFIQFQSLLSRHD